MAHRASTGIALRPYAAEDVALLERLLGDPAMMVHLGGPETPEAIAARNERYLAHSESPQGLFTVVRTSTAEAIGWVGYWTTSWQGSAMWECGWHVLPEAQGQGVATAAGRLLLEDARSRRLYREMLAIPAVGNAASNSLCRALGFSLVGTVEAEYPKSRYFQANEWRLDLEQITSADAGD